MSAVRDGVCVDTSMGFTPLEGLMMGTRSGTVDPGLLIYLLRHKGLDAEELDNALNYRIRFAWYLGHIFRSPPNSIGTSTQSGRETRR